MEIREINRHGHELMDNCPIKKSEVREYKRVRGRIKILFIHNRKKNVQPVEHFKIVILH